MDEMRSSPPQVESACRQSASEIASSEDAPSAPRSSSGEGKAKHGAPRLLRWMRRILRVDR